MAKDVDARVLRRRTYSCPEAAEILGVSRGSMYAAVRAGEVAAVRVGGRIVIPDTVIERLLDPTSTKPAA